MVIQRYLERILAQSAVLMVTLAAGLLFFFRILEEGKQVGVGNYTFWDAVAFVCLSLPEALWDVFPILILLMVVLVMGQLALQQELTALGSAGLGGWQWWRIWWRAGLFCILIAFGMSEIVIPKAQVLQTQFKAQKMSKKQWVAQAQGLWVKEKDGYLYLGPPQLEGTWSPAYYLEFTPDTIAVVRAKSAHLEDGHWVFEEAHAEKIKTQGVVSMAYPRYSFPTHYTQSLFDSLLKKQTYQSIQTLVQNRNFQEQSVYVKNELTLLLWQRALLPFYVMGMFALAVLGIRPSPRQAALGLKMFMAALVGFALYALQHLSLPLVTFWNWPVSMSAMFPLVALGLIVSVPYWKTRQK